MSEKGPEPIAAFDGRGEVRNGGGEGEFPAQGARDELANLGGGELGLGE